MKRRTAISLFTGAGGLDLGFEAAGFDTAVAVELDSDAAETLRRNRHWPILERDLLKVGSDEILLAAGLREGEADVLIGGPPCQPFSKAGYWVSGDSPRLDDPRAGTLIGYLRVLRDTLPRSFLLENVPGLAYKGKSEGLELIQRTVEQINRDRGTNYSFVVAHLNAADFGVPQLRQRVFVIGGRNGESFDFPAPAFQPPSIDGQLLLGDLPEYRSAWDAIGDLDDEDENPSEDLTVSGKWADLLPSIPEGENYLWHTERGGGLALFGWRRRYWSFLLKLAKTRPSWTLQAQPGPAIGPFHWRNRRLSVRELCRLQTIPDHFEVVGNLRSAQRQIGNAVPSALAEVLAREMLNQILGEETRRETRLVLKAGAPVPDPEPVASVPSRYRYLIGDHDEHPGTGQGYAASARRQQRRLGEEAATRPFVATST